MPRYQAPIDDMLYLLDDLFDAETVLGALRGYEELTHDLMATVLEGAGRLCEAAVLPTNQAGDAAGCRLEAGEVKTAPGTREAYQAFVEGGWPGLAEGSEWGGQGLPLVFRFLVSEILSSTNCAFSLFPGLTHGAVAALHHHGDERLKARYLPKLVTGEWTGAMALTEAHSGTDLSLLRTKAAPASDGAWAITGTKIFITAGDHDLTPNLVHLVLARLPDAPPGNQGISLFLVPKFLDAADAGIGARNHWSVGSLEHKMGIHGSPTCVINYDGALGWLVGQPHRGLAAMFTMMNAERLFVGVQGLGLAEIAYQNAAQYAKERLQGQGPRSTGRPAPIIDHPDVRRMLLTVRGFVEAARALTVWVAIEMDKAARHPDAVVREAADDLVAFMTPVVKAAFSDFGFESCVTAQQVLGGHGYVREWGLEQYVRDARIAQIYEGTNGVQAMDLVGRKLSIAGGRLPERFFAEVAQTIDELRGVAGADDLARPLAEALDILRGATGRLSRRAAEDPAEIGAAAADYLKLTALVALGWMWVRMAGRTLGLGTAATAHDRDKLAVGRFYLARVLPQVLALDRALAAGAEPLMALEAEGF